MMKVLFLLSKFTHLQKRQPSLSDIEQFMKFNIHTSDVQSALDCEQHVGRLN